MVNKIIFLFFLLCIGLSTFAQAKPPVKPHPDYSTIFPDHIERKQNYFEQIGYTQLDDQLINSMLAISDGIDISEGAKFLFSEDQFVSAFDEKVFKKFPKEEIQKTFSSFHDHKIENSQDLFNYISIRVEQLYQQLAPNFSVVGDPLNMPEKKIIFMSDPGHDIKSAVQILFFMKTLPNEIFFQIRSDYKGEELADYQTNMTSKEKSLESGLEKYGIKLPSTYNPHKDSVSSIIDHLFISTLAMRMQWLQLSKAIQNATGETPKEIYPNNDMLGTVFIRDFFVSFSDRMITSNFGFQFDKSLYAANITDYIRDIMNYHLEPLTPTNHIEGGDFVIDKKRDIVWLGYDDVGTSSESAGAWFSESFGLAEDQIVLLHKQYVNSKTNHLDMVFAPIDDFILYYPAAFNESSRSKIKQHAKQEDLVELSLEEVQKGTANLLKIGRHLIMSYCSAELRKKLETAGYDIQIVDVSMYLVNSRDGGGIHRMTNDIL